MRWLARFISLSIMLLLTGCTIEYNVIIDDSFKVKEEILLLENNNILNSIANNQNKTVNKLLDIYIDNDEDSPDIIDININKNDIIKKIYDNTSGVYISNDYSSLSQYNFSPYIYTLFEKVYVIEKNNNYIINISGFMYDYIDNYLNNKLINFTNDKIVFRINIPYNVHENNADYILDNTYIWEITKNNYKDKEIILNFSKKEKITNSDISSLVEEEPVNNTFVGQIINTISGNKTSNNWYIILIAILFALVLTIMFFKKKIDKKNKL